MMFFLVGDVTFHLLGVGLAHREGPIPVLPMEIPQLRSFLLDARGRRCLHLFDKFRNRDCPREIAQDVNVILDNAGDYRRTFQIPERSDQVACHDVAYCGNSEEWPPLLRAEDDVQQDACVRLRHDWGSCVGGDG